MADESKRRMKAMARAIQVKALGLGMVVVLRDQDGKVHCLAGHDFDLVGVYADGCRIADIAEDLEFCGVER